MKLFLQNQNEHVFRRDTPITVDWEHRLGTFSVKTFFWSQRHLLRWPRTQAFVSHTEVLQGIQVSL